jgi:hypothetical protein
MVLARGSRELLRSSQAGFRVRAVRAAGTRWYVWNPTTDNFAYGSRNALSLPDPALIPVMTVVMLPAWLLVTGRPEMKITLTEPEPMPTPSP